MKILLVGNYILDAQESMQRYAVFMAKELEERGYTVKLLTPRVILGRLFPARHPLSKWMGLIDKFLLFPRELRKQSRGFDLVHICDHSNAPYLKAIGDRPSVITCHDVMGIRSALGHYRENTTVPSSRLLKRMQWILEGLKSAKCIICISCKTREELLEILPQAPARLEVIHHSLNWNYEPAPPEQANALLRTLGINPGWTYMLHVGSNQWYKNRLGVLAIFSELRKLEGFQSIKLVMAGKTWTKEMNDFAAQADLRRDAFELIHPTNEQVQALYSSASAFLFPSFNEGFGWPILESQACGCPVITSNRAPMTEIAGKGAIYIDPAAPAAAALTISEQLHRRAEMVQAGFENLKNFTTEAMLDRYEQTYHAILQSSESSVQLPA